MSKASSIASIDGALQSLGGLKWGKANFIRIMLFCVVLILLILAFLLLEAGAVGVAKIVLGASMIITTVFVPPKYLIYAVIVYFPFESMIIKLLPQSLVPIVRYGVEVVLVIALMALLFRRRMRGLSFIPAIDLPIALFLCAGILSALVNQVPATYALLGLRAFFRFIPLYLLIVNAKLTRDDIRRITTLLIMIAFIEVLIGISQSMFGSSFSNFFLPSKQAVLVGDTQVDVGTSGQWASDKFHVFGTLPRYNDFGEFSALFSLLCAGLYYSKLKDLKRIVLLFMPIGLIAILLSSSRTALISLAVGMLVITFLAKAKKTFLALLAVVISLSLVVVLLWSAVVSLPTVNMSGEQSEQNVFSRMAQSVNPEKLQPEYNSNFRLFLIEDVGQRILTNWPFFGMGIGTFGSALSKAEQSSFYRDLGISENWLRWVADVEFVTIFGQTGIFGLLAFLILLFGVFLGAVSLIKRTDDPLISGLSLATAGIIAAMLVFCLTSAFFEKRHFTIYFWLFAGIIAIFSNMLSDSRRIENQKNKFLHER